MAGTVQFTMDFSPERLKYASDGQQYPEIVVNGTGFGLPPNIEVYRDWGRDPLGPVNFANPMVGPDFAKETPGSLQGNIFDCQGRRGYGHRQGGTNASVDNKPVSMVVLFKRPYRNFRVGHDLATPAGRTFSGVATPGQYPTTSVLKCIWLIDRIEGGANTNADVVVTTWTAANFAMVGNNCPYNVGGTNKYDFNGWNYYQGSAKAGTDPFVDNGIMTYTCSNSIIGTITNTVTNKPAFGSGAPVAQYDRASVGAWSGNGVNHDLSLHCFSYLYIALADDDNVDQRIEIMDSPTFNSSTKHRLILYKTWTDNKISFSVMPHYIAQGFTHYRITAGSNVITGSLQNA